MVRASMVANGRVKKGWMSANGGDRHKMLICLLWYHSEGGKNRNLKDIHSITKIIKRLPRLLIDGMYDQLSSEILAANANKR
jgi:hypothetical protein